MVTAAIGEMTIERGVDNRCSRTPHTEYIPGSSLAMHHCEYDSTTLFFYFCGSENEGVYLCRFLMRRTRPRQFVTRIACVPNFGEGGALEGDSIDVDVNVKVHEMI